MTIEDKIHIETSHGERRAQCNIERAQAYWVTRDTILWRIPGSHSFKYNLHYDPNGNLKIQGEQVVGGQITPLHFDPGGPDPATLHKFPHLQGASAFKIEPQYLDRVPGILKEQVSVSARDESGKLVWATLLQIPGVLDDLYTCNGQLGVHYKEGRPILKLWAPTARSVRLHLFPDSRPDTKSTVIPMQVDPASGVWGITGETSWTGQFYLYEVEVYVPKTCRVERNLVTDPYSLSLSENSRRSQIVDLDDPSLQPPGWRRHKIPPLEAFEDIVIYELHVRDFSVRDPSVSPASRGTYKAFTEKNSHGVRHLRSLAIAGLTHLHLLPVFDFASVNEHKASWVQPDEKLLSSFQGDSPEPQRLIAKTRDRDGFNWGYDPYHYTVPEGSYATDPDGATRILEFRQMVKSLHEVGLRVIMDVVYNHTFASGQDERSVLDKIVPGYYHRLNGDGVVETSTCCANTATEHAMMEKLMIDSLLTWATQYQVNGFRFDLMGHHMLDNMLHARQALDSLTIDKDGVDGKKIYMYGEGWDFGELGGGARGRNATQSHIGGTGIGAFNDRMRDAIRGGRPFGGLQEQGFITGLYTDPNQTDQGSLEQQKARLLHMTDWIRTGLAGNLKSYPFENVYGRHVSGWEIDYNGQPAAYAEDPQENVMYVSAHDNETLFDAIQLKASPAASLSDRIRMHHLGLSLVMLGQGIPFFLAGDDLLRSKSLDRNSYNSGDWFNALDFTCSTNNWGIGLPPGENERYWPVMAPLLANPVLRPTAGQIRKTAIFFQEMLHIRKSSALFRCRTQAQVINTVRFHNTGPGSIPGVVAMSLTHGQETTHLDWFQRIVVIFNARRDEAVIAIDPFKGIHFRLHPVQEKSIDPVVRGSRVDANTGTFVVPARTTAVFVAGKGIIDSLQRLLDRWRSMAGEGGPRS